MRQMLESGRYPMFYSDIINIDPFERSVTSLYLSKLMKLCKCFQINFNT